MSRRISLPDDSSDPPIKLFGCNIQLPDSHNFELRESDSVELLDAAPSSSSAATTAIETSQDNRKEEQNGDVAGPDKEDVDSLHHQEDLKKENFKSHDRKPTELNSGNEGKAFKKPDKILLCPRCNSMETKFCYFNNYNVNQPRHFCRSCQRYWTAGGTIRNVPVGAGRRKNKHLSPQFPQSVGITCNGSSSSPSSAAHLNLIDSAGSCGGGQSPTGLANPSGFSRENSRETHQGGCDTPFCNSVTTLLTLKDQNKNLNKYVESCSGSSQEALSLSPSRSSPSVPTTRQNNVSPGELVQTGVPFGSSGSQAAVLATLQGFPGPPPPAAYPWNIGWTGMAAYGAENGQAILLPWGFSPMATYPSAPGATPPSIPYPFVPPYMGWNPSSWNSTTSSSSQLSPPSSASNSSCSSSSPSLGKHSREGEEAVEKCIWVPKTLRMDDPDVAAKSSIWTTLGIKPDRIESFSNGGGRGKGEGVEDTSTKTSKEADPSLQANPAALSRSQAFQEST